jgi:hypothetical protein
MAKQCSSPVISKYWSYRSTNAGACERSRARARSVGLNKLLDEWDTVALAQGRFHHAPRAAALAEATALAAEGHEFLLAAVFAAHAHEAMFEQVALVVLFFAPNLA